VNRNEDCSFCNEGDTDGPPLLLPPPERQKLLNNNHLATNLK
jgi:hypothetical protein